MYKIKRALLKVWAEESRSSSNRVVLSNINHTGGEQL